MFGCLCSNNNSRFQHIHSGKREHRQTKTKLHFNEFKNIATFPTFNTAQMDKLEGGVKIQLFNKSQ